MMRLCVKEATLGISARMGLPMNGSLAMYRGRFSFIAENACENDAYAKEPVKKPHKRDFELNKFLHLTIVTSEK